MRGCSGVHPVFGAGHLVSVGRGRRGTAGALRAGPGRSHPAAAAQPSPPSLTHAPALRLAPRSDKAFISKGYDATSHFETEIADVLDMYRRITGRELDLDKEPEAGAGAGAHEG